VNTVSDQSLAFSLLPKTEKSLGPVDSLVLSHLNVVLTLQHFFINFNSFQIFQDRTKEDPTQVFSECGDCVGRCIPSTLVEFQAFSSFHLLGGPAAF